jgi:hypothetical protein
MGVFGHCRERCVGIFQHEFGMGVLLPGSQHRLPVGRDIFHWRSFPQRNGWCSHARIFQRALRSMG